MLDKRAAQTMKESMSKKLTRVLQSQGLSQNAHTMTRKSEEWSMNWQDFVLEAPNGGSSPLFFHLREHTGGFMPITSRLVSTGRILSALHRQQSLYQTLVQGAHNTRFFYLKTVDNPQASNYQMLTSWEQLIMRRSRLLSKQLSNFATKIVPVVQLAQFVPFETGFAWN